MHEWDATELLRRIDAGEFDRILPETLKSLSTDQLAEVCELMTKRQSGGDGKGRAAAGPKD